LSPESSALATLVGRGRELCTALRADGSSRPTQAETRIWQQDCAALVSQLSGGSKAHWLAREFSHAFLVHAPAGRQVEEIDMAIIVERILDVLEKAQQALTVAGQSTVDGRQSSVDGRSAAAAHVRRFEFVRDASLRPILEQAYRDSRHALAQGQFGLAFLTSCSVLEAVLTDALEQHDGAPVRDLSFEARIAAAEREGLIRGACARLPPSARKYRELANPDGHPRPDVTISEREARLAGQVLQVVMRDLDPGR
jgi:hypothetical protein